MMFEIWLSNPIEKIGEGNEDSFEEVCDNFFYENPLYHKLDITAHKDNVEKTMFCLGNRRIEWSEYNARNL